MSDRDLFEDTMNEVQEEMHRLMSLHLELMSYFRRVCEDSAQREEGAQRPVSIAKRE